eukprot:scaffold3453_cov230-Skeletonema_marinoi.AAC.16
MKDHRYDRVSWFGWRGGRGGKTGAKHLLYYAIDSGMGANSARPLNHAKGIYAKRSEARSRRGVHS